MSPTLTTFLVELVNFLVLAAALGWLLFRPVRAAIRAKQAAERAEAQTLAVRAADLDTRDGELRKRREAFEQELAATRAQRLAEAGQQADAIVAAARETAARETERGTQALKHVEDAQVDRLAHAVAQSAGAAVANLLTKLNGPAIEAALVAGACRALEAYGPGQLGSVRVESAAALSDAQRADVQKALSGRASATEFHVVPDVGAGLRVITARGLVDASLSGVAGEARRQLDAALEGKAPQGTT